MKTGFWQDVRFGARMLIRKPGFTLIAVLATALGISANTTIFSSADATLFRPLSFPNQGRLAVIFERNPEVGVTRGSASPGNVFEWRAQSKTLDEVIVIRNRDHTLSGDGPPERHTGYGVSAAFFDAIGIHPLLGRTFDKGEDEAGRAQVVVLRYPFWQTRFGGDSRIIGKQVILDDRPFEIIGVMPKGFDFPFGAGEFWTPFVFTPEMKHEHGNHFLRVMALLKPGIEFEQAAAELGEISLRIQKQFPNGETGHSAALVKLNDDYTRVARDYVPVLIGSALFVLLIACSNVANLLLARGATRRKEMAVRLALGASRWRLVRLLLTESVMLAVIGGVIGCVLAGIGIELLSNAIPPGMSKSIPGWSRLGLSYSVLAFTASISVLVGVLFGLAPALQATKAGLNETLKEGGGKGVGSGRSVMRNALVVTELALSLVLLIGAGLFVRSFMTILRTDLGVKPKHVATMSVDLPRDKYPEQQQRRDFFDQLLARVASLPGVSSAGAINLLPMGGSTNSNTFQIVGEPSFEKGKEPYTHVRIATTDYFKTIGTDLVAGRVFGPEDTAKSPRVLLANRAFVARYLKSGDALGRRIRFGEAEPEGVEIVGVVANVMNEAMDDLTEPGVYLPFSQVPSRFLTLVIRAQRSESELVAGVRNELAALDSRLPVSQVRTMEQVVNERRSPKAVMMWMLVIFGIMALVMAAVGTYAVVAYSVTQRTHEIGIRMALGAVPGDILKMVLRNGLKLAVPGIALGLIGAFLMTRVLSRILYGVTATDPLTFGGISILLAIVAMIACYVPARRATKVDPMIALRYE